MAAGMDDYLPKPVKSQQLEIVLGRWIGRPDLALHDSGIGGFPADTNEVLDLELVERLRELGTANSNPGFLHNLVVQYIAEVPTRMIQLQECAQRGDMAALGNAAHGLKGTSGTVGATLAASACAAMEEAAREGQVGPEHLHRVSAELARAASALRAQAP